MRRIFVILLFIALLPLRAWAGDAMAVEMALMDKAVQATHGDCHEHSAPTQLSQATQPSPNTPAMDAMDNCNHCAACQACFTVALEPAATQALLMAGSAAVPALTLHPYASAELVQGQKPPIS